MKDAGKYDSYSDGGLPNGPRQEPAPPRATPESERRDQLYKVWLNYNQLTGSVESRKVFDSACAILASQSTPVAPVVEQARIAQRERVQSLVYQHRLDTASAFDVATRLIENAPAFVAALAQSTPHVPAGEPSNYPPLPRADFYGSTASTEDTELFTAEQMHAYIAADRAVTPRAPEPAAPVAQEPVLTFPNPIDIAAALTDQAKARTSAENIADVLVALAAAGMRNAAAPTAAQGLSDVWEAINVYVSAQNALEKRRASGELMNADFLNAVDTAAEKVDAAILSANRAAQETK